MQSTRLFVGIPAYGGVHGSAFLSHLRLSTELTNRRIEVTYRIAANCGDIVTVRNSLLEGFLKTDCTHWLMVDADIEFEPSAVLQMLELQQPFIGAAVPLRRVHHCTECRDTTQFNIQPTARTLSLAVKQNGPALPVLVVGTALLLVTREAIEQMISSYPELEYADTEGNRGAGLFNHLIDPATRQQYGEDISFCRRWIALEGQIFCLRDCPVTHTGPVPIYGNLKSVADHLESHVQQPRKVAS
jgi:hypothetical protein